MKKLIYLMSLGLLINIGCSKEQNSEPGLGSEKEQESFYVINMNGETPAWEIVTNEISEITAVQNSAEKSNSNSAHAHGNIDGLVTFSGTQNNGGSHGSAEIETSSFHFAMEAVSVVLVGDDENQAVYGGLITEVFYNNVPPPPPPPPCPSFPNCPPPPPFCGFSVGSYLYFSVIDNGQGNNAELDQYSPFLITRCNEFSNGGATFPWSLFGLISVNPETNDKIKVNN